MTFRGGTPHPDELISASLTGDLDSAERATLDAHLAGCQTCRETLDAFREQRRMVHAMRPSTPPRDLAARVRVGIDGGRFAAAPWWRRPHLLTGVAASLGTVAAGILAVVVLSNLRPPEVAVTSPSPTSVASVTATDSAGPSASPTTGPTTEPLIAMGRGDVGVFVASGGTPETPSSLQFLDLSHERSLSLDSAAGVPISAALSPSGDWLAYITWIGESGAQEVRAIRLSDGETVHLGCSVTWNFTDRLAWSPDGRFLAYSLAGVDLGDGAPQCADSKQPAGSVDAWLFNTRTEHASRMTVSGDAYAADFLPADGSDTPPTLVVSHAAVEPWSEEKVVVGVLSGDDSPIAGVFMPIISPDGHRAMFWNGQMDRSEGGAEWTFVRGGLPYISGPSAAAWDPTSAADPLFRDLTPVGGEAFTFGNLAWSADGAYVAFWNGAWTGLPQNAEGDYPQQADAYLGRTDDGLSQASRVQLLGDGEYVADVKFDGDGRLVLVMVAAASAGIGDAPTAVIYQVTLDGSREPKPLEGVTADPTTWFGPPVVGQDAPPSPAP